MSYISISLWNDLASEMSFDSVLFFSITYLRPISDSIYKECRLLLCKGIEVEMKRIPLAERTDSYKHGFLVARMSDVLKSRPEYIRTKTSVLDSGIQFVDRMLDGYGFIFEKRSSDYAHDNVRLYRLSTKIRDKGKPSAEFKGYLEAVRSKLETIKQDPDTSNEDILFVGTFFESLSDVIYADLQTTEE